MLSYNHCPRQFQVKKRCYSYQIARRSLPDARPLPIKINPHDVHRLLNAARELLAETERAVDTLNGALAAASGPFPPVIDNTFDRVPLETLASIALQHRIPNKFLIVHQTEPGSEFTIVAHTFESALAALTAAALVNFAFTLRVELAVPTDIEELRPEWRTRFLINTLHNLRKAQRRAASYDR